MLFRSHANLAAHENQPVRRLAALFCTNLEQTSGRLHHDWSFPGVFFDFGRDTRAPVRLILVQGCLFMDFCYS